MPTDFFTDRFSDSTPAGRVIGYPGPHRVRRGGVDAEGLIAIDNGALRIQPLLQPGWGRAALAYGPFTRENGLTLVSALLNGHNTSQSGHLTHSFMRRLYRWARGDGSTRLPARLLRWRHYPAPRRTLRQFHRWWWICRRYSEGTLAPLDENLAVGWSPTEASARPGDGNAFVMQALGGENGQLCCRVANAWLPALRGVQNIPLVLVVILRRKGAAYYAASVPQTAQLPAPPELCPLAIDPFAAEQTVYASIHQSVLGQIGFHVDSRVYGTQVGQHPSCANWYGTAHAADSLRGDGALAGDSAQVGGRWLTAGGEWQRTVLGARPGRNESFAYLAPGKPSGLIHVLLETDAGRDACVLWRFEDERNCWGVWLGDRGCRLRLRQKGTWTDLAIDSQTLLSNCQVHSIQILDDGQTFSLSLDGTRLFGSSFTDRRLSEGSGVGLYVPAGEGEPLFYDFEAHPRRVTLSEVESLAPASMLPGSSVVIHEHFEGEGADLCHAAGGSPARIWRREFGRGVIARTGTAEARVQASAKNPNPGRTLYTVAWEHPGFADLEVEMTPPGATRGQGERGRGGFVFWEDNDNYIIVSTWLDDCYEGASVSSFFHLNGFEELYDAVWSNVGHKIKWGVPYRLRVLFDGLRYFASVDGEPVLYRSLTDVYPNFPGLRVNRVGLAANWEWGDDTGTVFRDFTARRTG